eukprot:412634-Prymnesium_polylepis.1
MVRRSEKPKKAAGANSSFRLWVLRWCKAFSDVPLGLEKSQGFCGDETNSAPCGFEMQPCSDVKVIEPFAGSINFFDTTIYGEAKFTKVSELLVQRTFFMVTRIPRRGGRRAHRAVRQRGREGDPWWEGAGGPSAQHRRLHGHGVVTEDCDLAAVDRTLAQLVTAGTMKIEVAESETNVTFLHSEAEAVKFAGAGGSVKNEGVLQKEIIDLKAQLQSSLDTMCKNQASASSQIDATNSEVQKLAVAMKDHEEQVKAANKKAAASVERLADTTREQERGRQGGREVGRQLTRLAKGAGAVIKRQESRLRGAGRIAS